MGAQATLVLASDLDDEETTVNNFYLAAGWTGISTLGYIVLLRARYGRRRR